MKKMLWISLGLLCCTGLLLAAQEAQPQYRVANRIHVPGEGHWDLLACDDATGRLFVSHGTVVDVVDTKAGKPVGTIPNTNGVHGIALAPDLNEGFITCGRDDTVVIFKIDSLAEVARVKSGRNPDAIAYDPATHRVFAFNGRSGDATVIDGKTNAVIGTVKLGGKPELAAVDGSGTVFVNLEDKSMVDKIDAKALEVKAEWPIAPGEEPTGLALDAANHRLFIGCANRMMVVMDAENGKVLDHLPIGERVDGVAFDPGLKRAYSSNGEGTLTVVAESDPQSFKVLENVKTQSGARTLAVDLKTHHIFLPAAEFLAAPPATADNPRPRPPMIAGSFVILDVEVSASGS